MNNIFLLIKKIRKRIQSSPDCAYLYKYFDEIVRELDSIEKDERSHDLSIALLSLIQDYAADSLYNTHSSANWVRYSARCFYCADYLTRYIEESLQRTMDASLNDYFGRLTEALVAPVLPSEVIDKYIEKGIQSNAPYEIYDNLIKKAIRGRNRYRVWDASEVSLALVYTRSVSRLIHQYISLYADYTLLKDWIPLLDTRHLAKIWYEYPNSANYRRFDIDTREHVSKYLDEMLEIHLSMLKLWYSHNPQEMIDTLPLEDLIETLEVYDDEDFEKTLRHMVTLPYTNKVEGILEHFTHDDEPWIVDLSNNLLQRYTNTHF